MSAVTVFSCTWEEAKKVLAPGGAEPRQFYRRRWWLRGNYGEKINRNNVQVVFLKKVRFQGTSNNSGNGGAPRIINGAPRVRGDLLNKPMMAGQ